MEQDEFWGIFLEICVTVVSGDRKVYNQKKRTYFRERGGLIDIECEPKDGCAGILCGLVFWQNRGGIRLCPQSL